MIDATDGLLKPCPTCGSLLEPGHPAIAASLASAGEDGDSLANQIVREVSELPDRTSPDDMPDMLLVTAQELHDIIASADANRLRALASEKEGLRRERDNARTECAWLAKRLIKLREALNNIARGIDDEGDRAYFGSTNDADWLKDIARDVDAYAFDRITRESKWPDYIETSRLAHEREAALRAENERLRKALEPFAKAASDYERQGEFFSNNVELVLRVSVFAAPEYHNSTAVQVGDLRRARSELEAGHE